jgi:hypothetical protein
MQHQLLDKPLKMVLQTQVVAVGLLAMADQALLSFVTQNKGIINGTFRKS